MSKEVETTKPFYQSKVFWTNTIGLLIVILEYLGTINIFSPEIVTTVIGIINLYFRFVGDSTKTKNLTLG
jgi:hypothetical protein